MIWEPVLQSVVLIVGKFDSLDNLTHQCAVNLLVLKSFIIPMVIVRFLNQA